LDARLKTKRNSTTPVEGYAIARRRSRQASTVVNKITGSFRRLSTLSMPVSAPTTSTTSASTSGGVAGSDFSRATALATQAGTDPSSSAGPGSIVQQTTGSGSATHGSGTSESGPRSGLRMTAMKTVLRLLYFAVDYNHLVRTHTTYLATVIS
jgi:hypothetical protein